MPKKLAYYRSFLKEFFSKPLLTGSVVPSSKGLAAELLRELDVANTKIVVEVGPGTGAITHSLLDNPEFRSSYFGLDINPTFIDYLRQVFPGARFEVGSAEQLCDILEANKIGKCDFIVSGLPWSLIRTHSQECILQQISAALNEEGEFVTFTYINTPILRKGRQFLKLLKKQFPRITMSQVVWTNFPPAIVFRCYKK